MPLDDPAENKHPGLPGKHILLAEDNDLNREIAAELLEMQGITVDAVENGPPCGRGLSGLPSRLLRRRAYGYSDA